MEGLLQVHAAYMDLDPSMTYLVFSNHSNFNVVTTPKSASCQINTNSLEECILYLRGEIVGAGPLDNP